jgi:hypothetical protein
VNKGRLSQAEMDEFFELTNDISVMVTNDHLYQVCFLIRPISEANFAWS